MYIPSSNSDLTYSTGDDGSALENSDSESEFCLLQILSSLDLKESAD